MCYWLGNVHVALITLSMLLSLTLLGQPGTVDLSFDPGTSINADVVIHSIDEQNNGQLLIGGSFQQYQGVLRCGLVRVHSNGVLDLNYVPPFIQIFGQNVVNTIVVDSEDGCLVGGSLLLSDSTLKYLVRLTPSGTLDTVFDQNIGYGPNGKILSIALRENGNMVIGGTFSAVNGSPRPGVAELLADGTLDPNADYGGGVFQFADNNNPNDGVVIREVRCSALGHTFILGNFSHYDVDGVPGFAVLQTDGTLLTAMIPELSFLIGGEWQQGGIRSLLPEPDGGLTICGSFHAVDGFLAPGIVQISANGLIENRFDELPDSIFGAYGSGLQKIISDGDLGYILWYGNITTQSRIVNIGLNGTPFSNFVSTFSNDNGFGYPNLIVQGDGNILLTEGFANWGGIPRNKIVRLHGRNGPAQWQCLETQLIALPMNDTWDVSGESLGSEVWYETTLDNCMSLTLSTCSGSSIEGFGPGLYTSCPSYPDSVIPLPLGTPNACGGLDYYFEELPAGTYWLAVQPDSGSYSFSISNIGCGPLDCMQVPGGSALPGTACDDSNPETENDTWTNECLCSGDPVINTDCNGVEDGPAVPGTLCDDQILFTTNDVWTEDCICMGYDCASELGGTALPGTPCDDGLAWTYNDVWNSDCDCQGVGMVGVRELNGQFPLVRIVPNPCSSGSFDLLYDASSRSIQVRLLDAASREVISESFNSVGGRVTVDRQNIPAGLYLVEVLSDEGRSVQRIILQ